MNKHQLVYLAGPMTGLTREQVVGWRKYATHTLSEQGFTVLDPARGIMFLKPEEVVTDAYEESFTENKHTVFTRDRFDSTRADILLVNFTGVMNRVSIGTVMEIAWANLSHKFVVTVMEKEGNPHMHAFIREASGVMFYDLQDAVDYITRTF